VNIGHAKRGRGPPGDRFATPGPGGDHLRVQAGGGTTRISIIQRPEKAAGPWDVDIQIDRALPGRPAQAVGFTVVGHEIRVIDLGPGAASITLTPGLQAVGRHTICLIV